MLAVFTRISLIRRSIAWLTPLVDGRPNQVIGDIFSETSSTERTLSTSASRCYYLGSWHNGIPLYTRKMILSALVKLSLLSQNILQTMAHVVERDLIFLPANTNGSRTTARTYDRTLDSKIRRHLMSQVGKTRQATPKFHDYTTLIWALEEKRPRRMHQKSARETHVDLRCQSRLRTQNGSAPQSSGGDDPQMNKKDQIESLTSALTTPVLHKLAIFEREWGEDKFSAYGFTLLVVAGKNALHSGMERIHRSMNLRTTSLIVFPLTFSLFYLLSN